MRLRKAVETESSGGERDEVKREEMPRHFDTISAAQETCARVALLSFCKCMLQSSSFLGHFYVVAGAKAADITLTD